MIKSISIILPLFNEAQRLDKTFDEITKFSKKKLIKSKEFIFVDDGSTDQSAEMIKNFIKSEKETKDLKIKLIQLDKNLGKGAALKRGIKNAKKKWILTSDIDFSVPLIELEKWIKKRYINENYHVYFGSRTHKNSNVKSKFYRKIIGNFLRFLISFFLGIKIKDTQCGFKLYKSLIAKKIFSKIQFYGYEHDIEIVLLLKKLKFKIVELPVTWKHVKLSKVNLIIDPIKMLFKVFLIRVRYLG